jgi:hypothetical protein
MKHSAIFRPSGKTRLAILSCSILLLLAGGGCGSGGSALTPPNDVARAALEGALKTWRDGGKPGALPGTDPVVQMTDTPWSQGDVLGSYEILKEDTHGTERTFTVRLTLTKPARVEEVQYYVMGSGPVLIFRDQDYERNINMIDGPNQAKPGAKKTYNRR